MARPETHSPWLSGVSLASPHEVGASGRLPRWARDTADTQDLVQETLFQTFKKIEKFEARGEGALFAYLRQAILNRIRDELRRANSSLQKSLGALGAP